MQYLKISNKVLCQGHLCWLCHTEQSSLVDFWMLFVVSGKKNPQVYLTVTDGLVNKCGNNSNGVIVLAAGTPGHTVYSSVE